MKFVFITITALILVGCSDTATSRFATLAEAKEKRAFDRGWLPPILPASARNIVEMNDLDRSIGTGSFEYDLSERASYLASLRVLGAATSPEEKDTDNLILTTNGSRWEIALQRTTGQARYATSLLR
jgi:hypothetical protein